MRKGNRRLLCGAGGLIAAEIVRVAWMMTVASVATAKIKPSLVAPVPKSNVAQ